MNYQSLKAQEYHLIWEDDFSRSGSPDPEKWNYETGFIRNQEEQIYTKRKKNLRVSNNHLEIIARKENYRNRQFDPGIQNYRFNTEYAAYTSGSIHTKGKFEFRYGRVDVRAKLPAGKGTWPAIWMLGANFEEVPYPQAGEIDIMESLGREPGIIHGSLHYAAGNNLDLKSETGKSYVEDASDSFHIYSIIWQPNQIDFLVDDQVYHSFKFEKDQISGNPFNKEFYLVLNLAIGGKWAGPVAPNIFPQKLVIDYVRVYQKGNKKAGL